MLTTFFLQTCILPLSLSSFYSFLYSLVNNYCLQCPIYKTSKLALHPLLSATQTYNRCFHGYEKVSKYLFVGLRLSTELLRMLFHFAVQVICLLFCFKTCVHLRHLMSFFFSFAIPVHDFPQTKSFHLSFYLQDW
jgi:hypothetical protein